MEGVFGGSFTRVPNSGAFTGGKNAFRRAKLSDTQNKLSKGDIITPDFMPHLVLESKFYAEFRFHQLLQPGPVPQLDEWITQCKDAVEDGDIWMVAFKINLKGWYVCIHEQFVADMKFGNHSVYRNATEGVFYLTDLKTFFDTNKSEILRLSA